MSLPFTATIAAQPVPQTAFLRTAADICIYGGAGGGGKTVGLILDCYRLELNPAYVDVIVRRWQVFTGRAAIHQASDQSFDERADRPDRDQSGAAHG
jgi:hypothetical protein